MSKNKWIFIFALLIAFIVTSSHKTSSKELTIIDDLQPPPWPLLPLNRQEREARLKFVVGTQNYQVKEAKAPMTEKDCGDILKRLQEPTDYNILEPDIIVQSRDDKKLPDNLISRCPTIEFDRVWFSYDKGLLVNGVDEKFDSLPLSQKDTVADFYHKKTGPIEFYNFSRFFNDKKVWGTFSEEGEFVCNVDRKLCSELEGYRLHSGGVIGPVVESETCTMLLPSKVKAGERFIVNTSLSYAFRELPNFYAYAEIDRSLYRLGLTTTVSWGELYRLLNEGSTTLIAEPANVNKGGLCVYETKH